VISPLRGCGTAQTVAESTVHRVLAQLLCAIRARVSPPHRRTRRKQLPSGRLRASTTSEPNGHNTKEAGPLQVHDERVRTPNGRIAFRHRISLLHTHTPIALVAFLPKCANLRQRASGIQPRLVREVSRVRVDECLLELVKVVPPALFESFLVEHALLLLELQPRCHLRWP